LISIDVKNIVTVTINLRLLTVHDSKELFTRLKDISGIHDKNIDLNLGMVESLDSSILAMLVEFNNHLKHKNRELTITNMTPFVKRTFELLHISNFFNIR
jgi:anti-anti-sigma factor